MSHAKFPPSSAERWITCPYSVKISGMFPDTSSAAAEAGTMMHEAAANHLLKGDDSHDKRMQKYLDAVRSEEGELWVERKVIIVPDLCWGTLDAGVLKPDSLSIFDLKWGKKPVMAVNNLQMKSYSVGALREFPLPRSAAVDMTIVQPNASSGWPVKRWGTTVDHVIQFRDVIHRAIDAALAPNPPAVAGAHCFWCPAKLHCHAYLLANGRKKALL